MPPLQKTVRGGGVSKGKQKIVKKIVKNVTKNTYNTINNYFQPQQGPAPAPPEAVPEKPPDLSPAGTSIVKPKPRKPKKPKKPKEKRSQWISSFGRRQDKLGAIGFGGVGHNGYRNAMKIKEGRRLQVHTLVNVYFNDPNLFEWKAEKAACPNGKMVTTDHILPGKELRSENYSWRLRWATKDLQNKNRDVSEDAKASYRAKRSLGLVQAREWRGRVKGKRRSWTGGTPDAWDDAPKWVGSYQAAAHTGHNVGSISKWVKADDGKAHRCEATGKDWEYRLIKHPTEPGYEGEKWWDLGSVEALGDGADDLRGVLVSDMGRVNDGTGAPPSHGTKVGMYRHKTIDGTRYAVHELLGWAFFGARPSDADTIDHLDSTKLDAEGCISNARSNLSAEWADKRTQSTTSRNGSRAATSGKRVRVRVKATGVVTEYDDACSAARALGVDHSFVSQVCRNDRTSTTFDAEVIEEENLVLVRTVVGPDGTPSPVTETERWAEIDPSDWEEGGKYFCVRGKKHARTDASKHAASARNKRKRGVK